LAKLYEEQADEREAEKQKYRNENICLPETPANFLAGQFLLKNRTNNQTILIGDITSVKKYQ